MQNSYKPTLQSLEVSTTLVLGTGTRYINEVKQQLQEANLQGTIVFNLQSEHQLEANAYRYMFPMISDM